jgi:hypothetical protein
MGSVLELISSLLSYVAFTGGAGGLAGYFFVRKRTEHEVGYGRRVEIAERIQDSVSSAEEHRLRGLGASWTTSKSTKSGVRSG